MAISLVSKHEHSIFVMDTLSLTERDKTATEETTPASFFSMRASTMYLPIAPAPTMAKL